MNECNKSHSHISKSNLKDFNEKTASRGQKIASDICDILFVQWDELLQMADHLRKTDSSSYGIVTAQHTSIHHLLEKVCVNVLHFNISLTTLSDKK